MSNKVSSELAKAKYHLQAAQGELSAAMDRVEQALIFSDSTELGANVVGPQSFGKWNQHGFSQVADDEGAVEIKEVTYHLLDLPEDARIKCYSKFYFEQAYRIATFPDDIARAKAYNNLSNRRFAVFLFGNSQPIDQAISYDVESVNLGKDYNLPPEHRNKILLRQTGIRTDAASMDWNPLKNAEYIYEWWKGKARAELQALGYKPEDYKL